MHLHVFQPGLIDSDNVVPFFACGHSLGSLPYSESALRSLASPLTRLQHILSLPLNRTRSQLYLVRSNYTSA